MHDAASVTPGSRQTCNRNNTDAHGIEAVGGPLPGMMVRRSAGKMVGKDKT